MIPHQKEGTGNDVVPYPAVALQTYELALLVTYQAGILQINHLNVSAHHLLHGCQSVRDGDLLRGLARFHF